MKAGADKSATPAFVAFPKSLYDAVMQGRWTANTLKVTLCVVRYTIGHRGQEEGAHLSRRLIAQATQLHEVTVRSVLAGLKSEGVVVETAPAKGRRAARIALEPDPSRWGKHSPTAPPLRRAVNPENIVAHEFDGSEPCGSRLAHNGESLCGSPHSPLAGVDSPASCGSRLASSEEQEERVLKEALDSGSTCEPPLSALAEKIKCGTAFCLCAKDSDSDGNFDVGLLGDAWSIAADLSDLKDITYRAKDRDLSEAEIAALVRELAERLEREAAEAAAARAAAPECDPIAEYLAEKQRERIKAAIGEALGSDDTVSP